MSLNPIARIIQCFTLYICAKFGVGLFHISRWHLCHCISRTKIKYTVDFFFQTRYRSFWNTLYLRNVLHTAGISIVIPFRLAYHDIVMSFKKINVIQANSYDNTMKQEIELNGSGIEPETCFFVTVHVK